MRDRQRRQESAQGNREDLGQGNRVQGPSREAESLSSDDEELERELSLLEVMDEAAWMVRQEQMRAQRQRRLLEQRAEYMRRQPHDNCVQGCFRCRQEALDKLNVMRSHGQHIDCDMTCVKCYDEFLHIQRQQEASLAPPGEPVPSAPPVEPEQQSSHVGNLPAYQPLYQIRQHLHSSWYYQLHNPNESTTLPSRPEPELSDEDDDRYLMHYYSN